VKRQPLDWLCLRGIGSIKIFAQSEWFATTAKAVYELPNSAMGLGFEEVSLKTGPILRQWLFKDRVGRRFFKEGTCWHTQQNELRKLCRINQVNA
jgi:hypothetical protein